MLSLSLCSPHRLIWDDNVRTCSKTCFPRVRLNCSCLIFPQDDRTELLTQLSNAQTEKSRLETELERYRECDPEVIAEVKQQTQVAKEAANRWTGMAVIRWVYFQILHVLCYKEC